MRACVIVAGMLLFVGVDLSRANRAGIVFGLVERRAKRTGKLKRTG